MMKRLFAGVIVAAALMPLGTQAGLFDWFGKKDVSEAESYPTNAVKRLHRTITSKEAETELLQLTGAKRVLNRQKRVILQLIDEKRRDLSLLDKELGKTFGMRPDRNYQFEAKTRALSEEAEKKSSTAAAPLHVVRTLKTDKEVQQFTRLATTKQSFQEDLTVLARLAQEKETALNRVNNAGAAKFAMAHDRNYWYDSKTKGLYEILSPAPQGSGQ